MASAVAATLTLAGTARAATYTANTIADSSDAGGCVSISTCSVRDAIAAANTGSGDTVVVPAGTYKLTLGALDPTNPMTITGGGARTTVIDAQGNSRVFDMSTPLTTDVDTIAGLTVTGGAATPSSPSPSGDGGGILTTAQLVLDQVAVAGNSATFGGAGINVPFESGNAAPLTITASTISGNHVSGGGGNGQGGGIAAFGPLTITNSTITGNSVGNPGLNEGGGIVSAKDAADLSMAPIPITLTNTTIAGNTIAGLPPPGSTANFGGGLSGDDLGGTPTLSQLTAKNTIIADNTVDGARQDCALVNTAATDHNLSSDATCGFADAGSKQGVEPQLGALRDNGGPTDTEAIATGSPALDAGTNLGCPGVDQRGTPRPQNGICDIGAFEYVPQADMALAMTAAPSSRTLGNTVTFTLTATNMGPDGASGVTVSDALPARTTLVSASPAQGSCGGTATLICALGSLASGASAKVTVVLRPGQAGSVSNTATVSATEADPNLANNSATAQATVTSPAPHVAIAGLPARCTKQGARLRIHVTGASKVKRVKVLLNGHVIKKTNKSSFTITISARQLSRARNRLTVIATNVAGRSTTRHAVIRRCRVVVPRFTG